MEEILAVVGVINLSGLAYALFKWYIFYSRVKGLNMKTLFEFGFWGPKYIHVDNEEFSPDNRRYLNKMRLTIYVSVCIHVVVFIIAMIIT